MANFNYERTIDLKGYLPDVLKNVKELKTIAQAEQPGVEALWLAVEDCMNDQFIATATRNGIARRESMLEIAAYASDTLEDRRFRILSRYNEHIPYTRKALLQVISTLCGEGGYQLTFLTHIFTIHIKVALTVKKQVTTISEYLERTLPYNMAFIIELMYNQHELLKHFTHARLAEFTHQQLRSEVLVFSSYSALKMHRHIELDKSTHLQLRKGSF